MPRLRSVLLLAAALAMVACADEGEPVVGHLDPCHTIPGALLGCPPMLVAEEPPTIEQACQRLYECGALPLDQPESDYDLLGCPDELRGDVFPADRLAFTLRCIQAATCQDLAAGYDSPCFVYGGEP